MRSIRSRLTIMLVLGISVLLIGAGVLISSVLQSGLQNEFDQALLDKAKLLIALIEDEGDAIEFDFSSEVMPEFSRPERPEYFQLWLQSDSRIERSPSLGSHNLRRQPGLGPDPVYRDIALPNGSVGRLVQLAFIPRMEEPDDPDEKAEEDESQKAHPQRQQEAGLNQHEADPRQFPERAGVLIVARDRTRLDTLIYKLRLYLAIMMLSLLIIMIVLVRLALRTGLRPLDDMRQQVARLDAGSLTTGIQLHTETAELTPVVHQMNALLHRLDAAFNRERQFSSDVAHELRTPLAELRMLTEVGGRWPDDRDAVAQYFADTHGICEQMERVVLSLLTLTRCERGVQPVQMKPIHLTQIVETGWQNVKQMAKEKSQRFECHIPVSYTIMSDYDMLLMMVSNLLGNAVLHSAPSSVIHCNATQDSDKTFLTISNPVKDLAAQDLNHIFERFWRKDTARSDGTHSGLGLAIVKAFADLLGVGIKAHLDEEQTFSMRLSL